MATPIAVATANNISRLVYPLSIIRSQELDFNIATSYSSHILDDVQVGDGIVEIPSQYSTAKLASIEFKIKTQLLVDSGSAERPLFVEPAAIGSIPGFAGRGIFIDGALSNYTFIGESGRLDLSFCPSVVNLRNMYGFFTIPASYNNVTWPALPASSAFFVCYIGIIAVIVH